MPNRNNGAPWRRPRSGAAAMPRAAVRWRVPWPADPVGRPATAAHRRLPHVGAQIVACCLGVPVGSVQQPLGIIGRLLPQVLG